METTQEQLALARSAKKSINTASTALKNQALEAMAGQLLKATVQPTKSEESHFSSQSNRYGSGTREDL